ncbi:MAG: tetratricopeptide repeat protein, partial [Woeseiaceae bacterium]|nr:tetratricopeptide repeat protein [Woeseiaceae bacterium]
MDDLQHEKEQIEQMRAWWSEYGNYVIGGIVLGGLGLFGWNTIQTQKIEQQSAASALYTDLTDTIVAEDVAASAAIVEQLQNEHAESPYATQARIAIARLYMDQNRDEDAANALRAVLDGNAGEEFKYVARLRLAKILLYQDKPDAALALLEGYEEGAFAARIAEALGDAYVALDRVEDARAAYQRAMAEQAGAATVDQGFVGLKLLDLPLPEVSASVEADIPDDQLPTNEAPVDDDTDAA